MNNSFSAGTVRGAVSTSIANFPDDVLLRIFDLDIQGPVLLPPPTSDRRRSLAQVCSKWRDVITSTLAYWSSFEFVQLPADFQHPENLVRLAEVLFRRSGEAIPLIIRFRGSLQSNVARTMFDFVLRSYAHRLWSLSFVVTKTELGSLFGANGVQFPYLQHIDLAVASNTDDGSIAIRPTPVKGSIDLSEFHRAPFLRQVALHILNGIHPADLRLPWAQLTQIDLGNTPIRPKKFMNIMKELLILDNGIFCIHFARSNNAGQSTTFGTISVPRVRRLRLRLIHPSRDARIFSKLRMPSLAFLWLEREEVGKSVRDMTLYETLLATLNAPLKHITMDELSCPATTCFLPRLHPIPRLIYQELDDVLDLAHHLTSLYLCPGVFIHPLLLGRLASGDILPSLETLSVSSVSGWDVVWMAQERNLASTRPESGPSSNSASGLMARPVALKFLDLLVMGCGLDVGSIQKLQDAVGALPLRYGYLFRNVPIPGRDS